MFSESMKLMSLFLHNIKLLFMNEEDAVSVYLYGMCCARLHELGDDYAT